MQDPVTGRVRAGGNGDLGVVVRINPGAGREPSQRLASQGLARFGIFDARARDAQLRLELRDIRTRKQRIQCNCPNTGPTARTI